MKTIQKALAAVVVALGGQYSAVAIDGHISHVELVGLILVPLIAGLTVWLVPNASPGNGTGA